MYVPLPELKKEEGNGPKKYSIVILLFDGTSQMNMIRSLPLTKAKMEKLGAVVMKGHHKVATGSTNNCMALLKRNKAPPPGRLDSLGLTSDLITTVFREHGWRTMLFEDSFTPMYRTKWLVSQNFTHVDLPNATKFKDVEVAEFSLNYVPVWQYLHRSGAKLFSDTCISYWGACDKQRVPDSPSYRCLQEKLVHKPQFSLFTNFLETYKDLPTFNLIHLNEYSHDDQLLTAHYDKDLTQMLEDLTISGVLSDTFFIVMGDHGFRAGSPFSMTPQGKIEDFMPMVSILPAPSFAKQHPEMVDNMKENAEVLTAHYDINKMLRQVLAMGVGLEEEEVMPGVAAAWSAPHWEMASGDPGTSLLRPVGDRNCQEVGTPMQFCSCTGGRSLEPAVVEKLATAVLADMDTALEPLGVCQKLVLASVMEASTKTEGERVMVEARLEVVPRNGQFVVRIFYPKGASDMANATVTLDRLDVYRTTSQCVTEQKDRPYCICY
jgi:hypothetical protein